MKGRFPEDLSDGTDIHLSMNLTQKPETNGNNMTMKSSLMKGERDYDVGSRFFLESTNPRNPISPILPMYSQRTVKVITLYSQHLLACTISHAIDTFLSISG